MAKFTVDGYIKELNSQLTQTANNMVNFIEDKEKEKTPVRTGRLKAGYEKVEASALGDRAASVNEVPYAGFVDLGTTKMAPRNMRQHAKNSVPSKANGFLPK